MEYLNWLSNGDHFLGACIVLAIVFGGLERIAKAFRPKCRCACKQEGC